MTLFQISPFLRPVAAGIVALMVSSITDLWFLRTEAAGVLSFVRRRTWWLVVNSIVAIRGFLIAVLRVSRMVSGLVSSGSGVPSLSMTMVRSRLVKTAEVDSLFGEVLEGLAGSVLAALWAQVGCGGGIGGGRRCAGVVVWYWSSCSCS